MQRGPRRKLHGGQQWKFNSCRYEESEGWEYDQKAERRALHTCSNCMHMTQWKPVLYIYNMQLGRKSTRAFANVILTLAPCKQRLLTTRHVQASLSGTFLQTPPEMVTYALKPGPLFTSAQLSTDAVSALRKAWVLIRLWKKQRPSTHINMRRVRHGLKKSSAISIQTILALFVLVQEMPNTILVVCHKFTAIWAPTKKLSVSWQFFETYARLPL